MKPIDVIIILFSVGAVAFAILRSIARKKNGKSGCGCDCSRSGDSYCSGCSSCPMQNCNRVCNPTETKKDE